MMKRFVMVAMFTASPLMAGSDAQDVLTVEQSGFTAVHVNEDVIVNIEVGPDYSVTATSDGAEMSRLRVNRYEGWLVFSRDARWFIFPHGRQDKFTVTITMPTLNEVKSFDGADVTVTGGELATLRAEVATGGHILLDDLAIDDAVLVANDNGLLTATGSCTQLTATGNSDGTIDAIGFDCPTAVVATDSDIVVVLSETTVLVPEEPELN